MACEVRQELKLAYQPSDEFKPSMAKWLVKSVRN